MINIGIVDDHAIVRTGLKQFFSDHVDMRVVAEASSGPGAVELVSTTPVDVLVMDFSMPGHNAMDVIADIRQRAPGVFILILSAHAEDQYALSVLRQGANGYINKACTPAALAEAVRTVARGRRHVSPELAEVIASQLRRDTTQPLHHLLSEREMQVFMMLARGQKIGEIARDLSLSVKTASTYRARVMDKLKMSANTDLTYYAYANHLID
jgi:DNA-binding NarL/FixJ family response regulator